MDEKQLLQRAENGDVGAMLELAKYYSEKARGNRGDKVGDVISAADFFESLNAEEKDDPELQSKAYKYYRMAAEAGNAEAMTELARRLYDGIGVERNAQNSEESKVWYRRGAEAGDPAAMRVVAFTSEDAEEKFKWYELSAELLPPGLNKIDSIKQTAINCATGRGTEKNIVKAEEWLARLDAETAASARLEIGQITGEVSWLEQAAEVSTQAMVVMAESYVTKNDFENALAWYEKAADAGDVEATSIIGDIFYAGEGTVEQNYGRALAYYSRAATYGYNMAAVKQAVMIYRGLGCPKDTKLAFRLFRNIARTRERFFGVHRFNSVAKFYLAKILEQDYGSFNDIDRAIEWYKKAAGISRVDEYESTHRVPEAMYKVADTYFMNGEFVEAAKIYEQLADKSLRCDYPYSREASKKLMWMNELGEGIPQDKAKAAECFKTLNGGRI